MYLTMQLGKRRGSGKLGRIWGEEGEVGGERQRRRKGRDLKMYFSWKGCSKGRKMVEGTAE